jgi:hypothetical protein
MSSTDLRVRRVVGVGVAAALAAAAKLESDVAGCWRVAYFESHAE